MDSTYNVRQLMPLYLPSGWVVVKNHFFDHDPPDPTTPVENEQYFGEDLLTLRYNRGVYDSIFTNPEQPVYYIWLGWYPEDSPEGQYVLTAACDDEDIARFETRDRHKVTRVLQYWVQLMVGSELPLSEITQSHRLFEVD